MDGWIRKSLSRIMDFEIPEDLTTYVASIDNEADLHEYMKTLLNFSDPNHKNFYQELLQKKFPDKVDSAPKQKKKISKTKNQKDFISSDSTETESKKKKTKFVNLYSQEGQNAQVVVLKGRHHCDCQASKHELINNCLNCGRIVCKQEGSGPCLFCGTLVCTADEEKEINANTKDGAKLMELLKERSRPKGWEAAIAQRNRLLEYDRDSERRTHVTDDDCDYFNVNSVWLTTTEREKLTQYQQELHEKKHASRLQKKMTFDFGGRQIIEDNTIDYDVDMEKVREITRGESLRPTKTFQNDMIVPVPCGGDIAPGCNISLLEFNPSVDQGYAAVVKSVGHSDVSRIQDPELQEITDNGRCLSMHQPWASLLVEGIKLHEGRTWYTNHRGRLWIASTAKPPDQELVRSIENQYRILYADKTLKLPSFYPTGCLLGCVNVDDCLPQEEYQRLYPDGESDSPYVFICSNPMSLKLRFPIKGQHKIYSLDKNIHKAAVKCLQTMDRLRAAQMEDQPT